ncbi:hypothetical protein FDE76_15335 [Clostridium botulinum]|uniref:Uncharacterized protein n=1 Tax=Clostridium botulinum (strain Eklund 17B / Type B) TaxID=935198 RepID=B2TMT9_CLOBB|nr:hypothetical protein CLL_A1893 [Clostridium botulinum B str. Eklund 17B (NRP)]MBY6977149.1 hypothetical protein [Clostridium botulinum]MBY6999306.1 hypothetical protein [Clostridium botulinum]MCR1272611.1 hypothetical protein [Clostridium botulinum]NFD70013.1 hypothetical protein [Clostridium botulinum]
MFNKKIFEVHFKQEGEDCNVHVKINTEVDTDGLITKDELEKIKNITLNIYKRVNIKNGDDKYKLTREFN